MPRAAGAEGAEPLAAARDNRESTTGFALLTLEHLDVHYVDRILIRVHVGAELYMMTIVSFEFFGIHNVPALLVLVAHECNFVAFHFDCALQRLQGSRSCSLV